MTTFEDLMKVVREKPPMTYEQAMALKERALNPPKKSKRGFASMSPERLREVSSIGSKKAHDLGVAHKWTSEEASRAGKIGGRISKRRKREQG